MLTWLAARTSTLRLGTAVMVLAWHNPILLAEQAAPVDVLSGGRFWRFDDIVLEPPPLQRPHPADMGQRRARCVHHPCGGAGAEGALYGSPNEIAEKLAPLRDVGVHYGLANILGHSRDTLRTFASEVMPRFRPAPDARA